MKYFEKSGSKNTDAVMAEVIALGKERGIRHIVVASASGRTAEALLGKGFEVTVVTHQAGFHQAGEMEISQAEIKKLTDDGMKVYTGTHFFAGADRSVNRKFGGVYPAELMAHTLRILGEGFKVCIEVAVMALDGGCLPWGEEIIAVGGTGKGADTAVILVPGHSQSFFETDVKEIICMPRGRKA